MNSHDFQGQKFKVMVRLKNTLCAICLSSERQFVHDPFLLNEVSFLCSKFLPAHMLEHKLCWECHKKLKNVMDLHKQAQNAQKLIGQMANIAVRFNNTIYVQPLSTLKSQHLVAQLNILPINPPSGTPIRIEPDIEAEIDHFEILVPKINKDDPLTVDTENHEEIQMNSKSVTPVCAMNQVHNETHIYKQNTAVKATGLKVSEPDIEAEIDHFEILVPKINKDDPLTVDTENHEEIQMDSESNSKSVTPICAMDQVRNETHIYIQNTAVKATGLKESEIRTHKPGIPLTLLKKIEEKNTKYENFGTINVPLTTGEVKCTNSGTVNVPLAVGGANYVNSGTVHVPVTIGGAKCANSGTDVPQTAVKVQNKVRGVELPVKVTASPSLRPMTNNERETKEMYELPVIVKVESVDKDKNGDDNVFDFENLLPELKITKSQENVAYKTSLENKLNDLCIPIQDYTNNTNYRNIDIIKENMQKYVNIPIEDWTNIKAIEKPPKTNKEKIKTNHKIVERIRFNDSYRIFNDLISKNITKEEMVELQENERKDPSYLNANFKCDLCVFGYKEENYFKAHLNKHKESYGAEMCSVCELRFKDKETLETHEKSHYIAFFCTKCEYASRFLPAVAAHHRLRHRPPASPDNCCDKCDAVFSSKEKVKIHLKVAHNTPTCNYCDKSFTCDDQLKKHVHDVHKRDERTCTICHKILKTVKGLKNHIWKQHTKKKKELDADGNPIKFHCKPCDRTYKDRTAYNIHLRFSKRHNSDKIKLECDHCGSKFLLKSQIAEHIERVHLKVKRVKCELCGRLCYKASDLHIHHTRYHLGIKPPPPRAPLKRKAQCSTCGKTFYDARRLEQHLRVHTGERPFHCPSCEYRATQKSSLYTHYKYKHKDKPMIKFSDIKEFQG